LYELPISCRTSDGVEIARATSGAFGFVTLRSGLQALTSASTAALPASVAKLLVKFMNVVYPVIFAGLAHPGETSVDLLV
jgi:hypothetical protein